MAEPLGVVSVALGLSESIWLVESEVFPYAVTLSRSPARSTPSYLGLNIAERVARFTLVIGSSKTVLWLVTSVASAERFVCRQSLATRKQSRLDLTATCVSARQLRVEIVAKISAPYK